jgi:hypothetical protein
MDTQRSARVPMVESSHEYCCRDDEQKGYRRQDRVGGDVWLVTGHGAETIPHTYTVSLFANSLDAQLLTIVAHGLKVQALQVRQEECIPL